MHQERRNHSPEFNANVALQPVPGDRTLADLSVQFDVHLTPIRDLKKKLPSNT